MVIETWGWWDLVEVNWKSSFIQTVVSSIIFHSRRNKQTWWVELLMGMRWNWDKPKNACHVELEQFGP